MANGQKPPPSALLGIENDTHQKMRVHYLPRLVLFFLGYRKRYPADRVAYNGMRATPLMAYALLQSAEWHAREGLCH